MTAAPAQDPAPEIQEAFKVLTAYNELA